MKYIYVFLISMLPLIELRGAVVYGVALKLNLLKVLVVSVLGNMLVVPFIFLFARRILIKGSNLKYVGKFFEYILNKGHKAGEKLQSSSKYGVYVALFLFVGIPLPGTGAWTGTLAASMLDLDFKKSSIAVLFGVLLAFFIMCVVSIGIFGVIKWVLKLKKQNH